MDLKRIIDGDYEASPRPLKRQSSGSSHLPTSPEAYATSSQPTAIMDKYDDDRNFDFFDRQSTASPPATSRTLSPQATESRTLSPEEIENPLPSSSGNYVYGPGAELHFREESQDTAPIHSDSFDTEEHELDPDLGFDPAAGVSVEEALDYDEEDILFEASGVGDDPAATPTYQDCADGEHVQAPAKAMTSPSRARLDELNEMEREQYYAALWGQLVVELKDLAWPKLCSTFPALQMEILSAYLKYVTVRVKVWSNYDSASQNFFWRPLHRYNDCGKLIFTPRERRRLSKLDPKLFQVQRVVLDVGTPFRTLCHVVAEVVEKEVEPGYALKVTGFPSHDPTEPTREFTRLINEAMSKAIADGLPDPEQVGLTLRDLDEIAKDFCLKERILPPHMRVNRGGSAYQGWRGWSMVGRVWP